VLRRAFLVSGMSVIVSSLIKALKQTRRPNVFVFGGLAIVVTGW
jgi:hypothetical protein